MENLYIPKTLSTPDVLFNFSEKKLSITGICCPENPKLFFAPIFQSFQEYQKDAKELTIDICLNYFNTGSSKCLVMIFQSIYSDPQMKEKAIINWISENDDLELKESGEVFEEVTGLKFNYVSI